MASMNDHHRDGENEIIRETNDSSENIVPTKIVASRLLTHTSTTNCSSDGGGVNVNRELLSSQQAQQQQQNQHHLLLPLPQREPGYNTNTNRKTVYKRKKHRTSSGSSNDGSKSQPISIVDTSNDNANANTLSRMEETLKGIVAGKKHHRHQQLRHHHQHDSAVSSAISPKKSMHKRSNKKRIRSNRSGSGTASPKSREERSIREGGNSGGAGNSTGSGTDDEDYGTEDGYAGSVSSNDTSSARNQLGSTSPSPSASSSLEECEQAAGGDRHKAKRQHRDNPKRTSSSSSSSSGAFSSDLADFSSSGNNSETMDEEGVTSSPSPSLSSSSNYEDSDGLEKSFLSAKRNADAEHERIFKTFTRRRKSRNTVPAEVVEKKPIALRNSSNKKMRAVKKNTLNGRPPILTLGCDVMAHILTYLDPPNILDILTMPLSTVWQQSFTSQPELWRVLCLVEPFKATMDDPDPVYSVNSSDEETYYSIKARKDTEKHLLDKYRLLYTSFVRCMKYISQIRDDAVNGRPPAYIDYGISGTAGGSATSDTNPLNNVDRTSSTSSPAPPPSTAVGSNKNLQMFLAKARDVVVTSTNDTSSNKSNTDDETKHGDNSSKSGRIFPRLSTAARVATAVRKTKSVKNKKKQEKKNRLKFGRSMITKRLLGPPPEGEPGNLNLPWSCAIYSIVNWMVAFSDVEGIQTLCMKVLPVLLENEQHRLTANTAGLADVVLRAMVMFSESAQLHIASFHTLVLLSRPHGGKEGMLFHNSMTAGGIFGGGCHGKSGIAVMLDSMRRFEDNAALLAMSCWALVNIALVSDQKAVLVKLGGIQAITNAMYRHPFSAELQFRALFALINLVIPSVEEDNNDNANVEGDIDGAPGDAVVPPRQIAEGAAAAAASIQEQLGELNETTEKEIIDELVEDIASLVVRVMKNFCSSEAIINRACLVLHNLSLTEDYHAILLWTPQCYQMLEWCVANYRTDQVLQQSATGTLHRLQCTLSLNEDMRERFSQSLRTQQQQLNLK